jgi:hypothetical protein
MRTNLTKRTSTSGSSPQLTISYENIIQAVADEITARIDLQSLAPQFRTQKHKALLREQHVESQRERFREWELLGNHYADVLGNPNTPAELHNALGDELDELANQAGVHLTMPELLRLIYPWLRYRLCEKGVR